MTANATIARDQTFDLIKAAVEASLPGTVIRWEGVEEADPPAAGTKWMRVSLHHVTGNQASLAGASGARRWNRTGFVSVQCFAPLSNGGVQAATEMASVVRDALQGAVTEDCVWFRDARINEVGPDNGWYQVNATIFFDYDEVR